MRLAKQHLDVGLFTNNLGPMLRFWQDEVGLPLEEVLPTGSGNQQHRHGLNGGVLKINHARDQLEPAAPSGYHQLLIARDGMTQTMTLSDPDANRVTLVPRGFRGVTALGIVLKVASVESATAHYGRVLGFEPSTDSLRCGETLVFLEEDREHPATGAMRGRGYRYLTVQVFDADTEYAGILERGGTPGLAPRTMGQVARFGFVRDPDGNWLEISQRASLTGPLPA